MNISKSAHVNNLLDDYTASLDALPFKIAHHFSDLRELDAVLGGSIASLNKKMHLMLNALENPGYTTRERFELLRDVAEDAAKLKMGNEDKIRLAAAAVEELKQHSTHSSHLLAQAHALNPAIPPHLPAPSTFPHVAPLSASYIPRPPPDEKRKSHKRGAAGSKPKIMHGGGGDEDFVVAGAGAGEGRTPKRKRRTEEEKAEGREGREKRERRAANGGEKAAVQGQDVEMDPVGEEEERVVRPRRERKRVSPPTAPTPAVPALPSTAPTPLPATAPSSALAPSAKAETPDNVSVNDPDGDGDGEDGEDNKSYCFCGGVSYGEMIACDDAECEKEWFHLECLGIERPAENVSWFCDDCKARRSSRNKGKKAARGRGRGRARGGK